MSDYLTPYATLLICAILSCGIALALLILPFLLATRRPDAEKLSAYECGFPSFKQPRQHFSIHYYLIAILFIVFDLEFALLVPWTLTKEPWKGVPFWVAFTFIVILAIGFLYEWKKGALEWE